MKFNKSGAPKVPILEPEIVSERCEKLEISHGHCRSPNSKNNLRFIFTCMELASGFPFAIALKTYTADETAKALLSVISILGAPLHVLSADILAHLSSATFLSKLDLLKGFHQVPLSESSKHLTTFTCLQGKFQYRVMPFILTNAPATFQLLMQSVLLGLENFSLPYIDDGFYFIR